MARLHIILVWICLYRGLISARHTSRGTGIGRVGAPVISFDPLSLLTSGSMAGSSASSSASAGRSSASSSAGASRSLSSSSVNVVPLRQTASRRQRPRFTRREGRPLLIISPGVSHTRRQQVAPRQTKLIQTLHQPQPQQTQQNHQVFHVTNPNVGSSILDLLGLSPSVMNAQRGATLPVQPPGVAFLGNQGLGGVIPSHYPLVQRSSPQLVSQPVQPAPLTVGAPVTAAPIVPFGGVISKIGSTGLEVVSGTRKGEIIIRGAGGSIVIGPELLTGISTARTGLPFFSEFEEVELEGAAAAASRRNNKITVTDPGKGSIVIERNPSPSGQVGGASSGEVFSPSASASSSASSSTGGASSSASAAAGGASASASASSSAGGASSSASSSASAGGGGVANSPIVMLDNGISVEKGNNGQVITLGQSGLRTHVITMGGPQGQVSVDNTGGGIQAPGNATFIVGG